MSLLWIKLTTGVYYVISHFQSCDQRIYMFWIRSARMLTNIINTTENFIRVVLLDFSFTWNIFKYMFESIDLNLYNPDQNNSSIESQSICDHIFSYPKLDYKFHFLVAQLAYIFFLSYISIIDLLWRQECVLIHCMFITNLN